jgi:O-antigen/teichoic acid export membrane protein
VTDKLNLARVTIWGTVWTYTSYYSGKFLILISTIILARLLSKDDFGVAGYALVAISFLEVLNDLGIGPALIYHRDEPKAADTAFWLGLIISLILCAGTYLAAPFVGAFFNDNRAVPVTQALGFTFPIVALRNVHNMLLHKSLAFGQKFIPDFTEALSKGGISILMALWGFGVWSLIGGQIASFTIGVFAYWWVTRWRPSFHFAPQIARSLLFYGLGIVSVNTLGILLNNIDYLFVGRFLGATALGVYTLAFRLPDMLIMQFCNVIANVIFPVYTKLRDDPQKLTQGFLATTRYVSLITVPLGLGLALIAKPFILTFFTDKWIEAAPVLQAISLFALFLSLSYNAGDVYKAQGRPGILMGLSFVRLIILLPAMWWAVTIPATIVAVGWVHAIVAFLGTILNLVVASRLLKIPFWRVLNALRSAALSGMLMGLAIWGVLELSANSLPLVQLVAGVGVGVLVYAGALWLLQREVVIEASSTLRAAFLKR